MRIKSLFTISVFVLSACKCENVAYEAEPSDSPRGWEISFEELLEQLNKWSSCEWHESGEINLEPKGEVFEIHFDSFSSISVESGYDEGKESCVSYVDMGLMFTISQNEETETLPVSLKRNAFSELYGGFEFGVVGLTDGIEEGDWASFEISERDDFTKNGEIDSLSIGVEIWETDQPVGGVVAKCSPF